MVKKISKKKLENLSDEEITRIFNRAVAREKDKLIKKGILKKESDKKENDWKFN